MLNKATIIGNLGNDVEVKHTQGGQAVTNLRVATTRRWTDKQSGQRKEETEWHDVEVWGKQADSCGVHLKKGRQLCVEGRIKTERWEKDGAPHSRTKIIASSVIFLGRKPAEADQLDETPDEEAAA